MHTLSFPTEKKAIKHFDDIYEKIYNGARAIKLTINDVD